MQSSRATSAATGGSLDKRFLPLCTARLRARSGRPVWLLSAILAFTVSTAAAEPASASGDQTPQHSEQIKPVPELRFDGDLANTSGSHTSGSRRTCTGRNSVAFVEGRQGRCASFDGRSWVDTGVPQQELGEQFTIECWVNPESQQSLYADVFGNHVSEGLGFVMQQDSSNTNQFYVASGTGGGNGCEPWTQAEKDAVKACVETYKSRRRPLVRAGDLYHILPRPDGRNWDGMEYYDPTRGTGAVYLFKPAAEPATQTIRFKGLDARQSYRLTFEDSSHRPAVVSAAELMDQGLPVTLSGAEVSELIFFEVAR